jgi:preprotein translocase SecE subunit
MNRFINYLHDTRGELKHVSWPTQRQTIIYTILVILISIVTSIYLGVFDYLLSEGIKFLVD